MKTDRTMINTAAHLPRLAALRSGFSLLELVVVLFILLATAALIRPIFFDSPAIQIGDKTKTPSEVVTDSSMTVIRDAMIGEQGVLENLMHEPNAVPRTISELVEPNAPPQIQTTAPNLAKYNPMFGIGWRGPYLLPTGKKPTGEPTVVDGWGHEIELQVDYDSNGRVDETEATFIRVVSAGPNGKVDTPSDPSNMRPGLDETEELTMTECGDDLVMFLLVPDARR